MNTLPQRSTGERPTALLYTRVSKKKQAKDGFSLKAQQKLLLAHCERNGWEVVEHFVGAGESAYQGPRDEFDDALDYMSCTDTDFFCGAYVDRLFRNVHQFCHVEEQARTEGWFMSIHQMGASSIDTRDPTGWFLLLQLVAAAELDSRIKSVRVTEGLAQRRAAGERMGPVKQIDELTEKRIKNLYSRGNTVNKIVYQLNQDGLPAPNNSPQWSYNTVYDALRRWGYLTKG